MKKSARIKGIYILLAVLLMSLTGCQLRSGQDRQVSLTVSEAQQSDQETETSSGMLPAETQQDSATDTMSSSEDHSMDTDETENKEEESADSESIDEEAEDTDDESSESNNNDDPFEGLEEHEVIIETFEELKYHLTTDTGKTTLYLGADITMKSGGIQVLPEKGNFTIDGRDPRNGITYTLREFDSSSQGQTISVSGSTHQTKYVTLKNMVIFGRNYYGTVSFNDDASRNSTLHLQNVIYDGPQPVFIPYGTLILDDVEIDIHQGYSEANEVAEASYVIMRNKVSLIQSSSNVMPFFRIRKSTLGVAPGIAVEAGAQVTATVYTGNTATSFVNDESTVLYITFEENSFFEFTGQNAFWDNNMPKGMRVGTGAQVYIRSVSRLDRALVRIYGDLSIEENAVFVLENRTTSAHPCLYIGNSTFNITNPKYVLFYNSAAQALYWGAVETKMTIQTEQINYWQTAAAGGFENNQIPTYSWMKADEQLLEVKTSGVSGTDPQTITSNYDSVNDYATNLLDDSVHTELNQTSFKFSSSRIISIGQAVQLAAGYDPTQSRSEGRTAVAADILVEHLDAENGRLEQVGRSMSDDDGSFAVNLQSGETWLPSDVYVQSHKDYMYSKKTASSDEILILEADDTIDFGKIPIDGKSHLLPRFEPEVLEVSVFDSRINGNGWKLTLTCGEFKMYDEDGSLAESEEELIYNWYYVDENEVQYQLETGKAYLVTSQMHNGSTILQWSRQQGPLLEVDTVSALNKIIYQADLIWTLTDAP